MEREKYKAIVRGNIRQKGFYFVDKKFREEITDIEGFVSELNSESVVATEDIKYEIQKGTRKTVYFIYDSNGFEPVRVKSVCGFLEEVYKYHSHDVNRYFRGEKAYYQLIPSLFRKQEWVKNEMKLNARVYNDRPGDFADCNSTFDKLVRLKHYLHPSRLLDISSSPLVALFFACDSSKKDKTASATGVVLEAYCREDEEKYSVSSDTVVMLTAMTNTALNLTEDEKKRDKLSLPCREKKELSGDDCKLVCPKIDRDTSCCYYNCWPVGGMITQEEALGKDTWANRYIGELCHQCKKEGMSIYWDDVCFNELNQCILVKPPLNNDRIVRQQGCFIMCGMNPENIYEPPKSLYKFFRYPNDNSVGGEKKKAKFYFILPNNKPEILRELKVLGMDKYYFFPELEREIEVVSALNKTADEPGTGNENGDESDNIPEAE